MKNAYFAGGCFWCITPSFKDDTEGVIDVVSGYCGGDEQNPKYEDVKHQLTHQTLHANFYVQTIESEKEAADLDKKLQPMGYKRVTWMEWQELAVPRLIDEANRRIAEAWF